MPTSIGFRVSKTNKKHQYIAENIKQHAESLYPNVSEYIASLIYADMTGQKQTQSNLVPTAPELVQVTEPVQTAEPDPTKELVSISELPKITVNEGVKTGTSTPVSKNARESAKSLVDTW